MDNFKEILQELITIRGWFNDPKEPYGPGRRAAIDKIISKYANIHYGCVKETMGDSLCSKWCSRNTCTYSVEIKKINNE